MSALSVLAVAVAIGVSATGTPAEAAFPGLNGRIACGGLRGPIVTPPPPPAPAPSRAEIFTVNPDGTGETVLTSNATRDGDPQYSPDGTKIAFEGRRVDGQTDNSEIYVANNDGDLGGPDLRRLTFNNGERTPPAARSAVAATDRSPSWSPDGTQIVFHSGRETTFSDGGTSPATDFEIYKMSATTGENGGLTPATRLTNRRGQDAIPSWNPDGTKIAFQSLQAGTSFNLEIFTMNPDGTGLTNISNNPGTPDNPLTTGREDSDAIDSFGTGWSPDGKQLAYSSTRDNKLPGNQNFEIFKINRDGTNRTRLTLNKSGDSPGFDNDYDSASTWSPDGKRILFISGRTSTGSTSTFLAYTMDATVGEIGGLQPVAESNIFERCDWQALRQVTPTPTPTPTPTSPYYNIPTPTPTPTATPTVTPTPTPTARKRPGLSATVRPKRDRRRPFRYTTRGTLKRPSGVSQSAGCKGKVRITVKRKGSGKTLSSRLATVKSTCKFTNRVTFTNSRRFGTTRKSRRRGTLRFTIRFQGNARLLPRTITRTARYG